MDILTDFLETAGVTAEVTDSISASTPWQQQMAATREIPFYAVNEGNWELTGAAIQAAVSPGEVLFLMQGQPHRLRCLSLHTGLVIRGQLRLFSQLPIQADPGFPARLLLRSADVPGTGAVIQRLADETRTARPGWDAVATRLVVLLFIDAMRAHSVNPRGESTGWLRGISDSEIGQALKLMHEQPEHRWTVEELAQALSVSRSAFAARFKQVTGRAPLNYLTWWRLHRAAVRLRRRDGSSLTQIAKDSGYDSDVAFSKAFRRLFGKTPTEVRRHSRNGSSPLQEDLKKQQPFEVVEQETGLNLFLTSRKLDVDFTELFRRHQLEAADYNALRILRGLGRSVPREELLSQMIIPAEEPDKLVQGLAQARLVTVESSEARDSGEKGSGGKASQQALTITSLGLELLARLDSLVIGTHQRQLAHLSPRELTELNRLLVKIRHPAGSSEPE